MRHTKKQILEAIAYWEKVLEEMDSNETVTLPDDFDDKAKRQEFIEWANSKFNGSAYESIVSDVEQTIEGPSSDAYDPNVDTYEYSEQDAIDEETFWNLMFDEYMPQEFGDGDVVDAKHMVEFLKREGKRMAEDAFDKITSDPHYSHLSKWSAAKYSSL